MPKVCYYKPNRTKVRKFTAKDAGRIICEARRNGYSQREIMNAAGNCLSNYDCDCERIRQVITDVLTALAAAIAVLAIPEALLLGWAVRVLGLLRFIPQAARLEQLLRELPLLRGEFLDLERRLLKFLDRPRGGA